MKKLAVAIVLTLASFSAFALSESNYEAEYKEKIIPLIESFKNGIFKGANNINIHYATYSSNESANRCLVILPGRSEPLEKYAEVVYDLDHGRHAGAFRYFLMDHRGQGSSARMINDEAGDSEKGYVDHFENYAADVKTFLDSVVGKAGCREKLLLAHSLGAGIAVDFMQKNPEYFDRAFLTSPMLKIQTAPYSYAVARSIVLASMAAGRGKKFAVGQKPFNPNRNFEANAFTTSKVRYNMAMDMFDLFPQTRLGGVTNRWLNEVMSATSHIRKKYDEIKLPMRVAHAGNETYSEPDEMIRLCEEAPHCNRVFLKDSKHEVLMDQDHNRGVVLLEIETFFN